jgi:phosphohistidine phosphatase
VKTLYILRHAKAVADSSHGDAARSLAKRGRKAAEAMGAFLGSREPLPALILCSPAARTRETLDLVLPALHPTPSLAFEEGLYLATATNLLERLQKLPKAVGCALVIGHNPGLHELAARLAVAPGALSDGLPTAALVALEVKGAWTELQWHRARLVFYRTPKDLKPDLARDAD